MFGPLEFSRRDLMALNIQRARDHGIPDYNTVREAYGLKRRETYEEINPEFFSNDTRNGPEVCRTDYICYKFVGWAHTPVNPDILYRRVSSVKFPFFILLCSDYIEFLSLPAKSDIYTLYNVLGRA